jgi:hypothetical protein
MLDAVPGDDSGGDGRGDDDRPLASVAVISSGGFGPRSTIDASVSSSFTQVGNPAVTDTPAPKNSTSFSCLANFASMFACPSSGGDSGHWYSNSRRCACTQQKRGKFCTNMKNQDGRAAVAQDSLAPQRTHLADS